MEHAGLTLGSSVLSYFIRFKKAKIVMGKIQNIKLQNERLNTKNEQNNILMPSER